MDRDWRTWPDGAIRTTRKVADWFQLSLTGWMAVFAAFAAMTLATVGLLAVSHDVLDHGRLAQHDLSYLNFFIHLRSGWSIEVSRIVTQFGGVGMLVVLALTTAGLLWWRGARLSVVLAPVLVLGSSASLVAALKPVIHRARPPLPLHLVAEGEPSFPSGHSTNSAALFLTIALLVAVVILRRPIARVLTVGFAGLAALLVGLSRLVLGVHWPTDVLPVGASGRSSAFWSPRWYWPSRPPLPIHRKGHAASPTPGGVWSVWPICGVPEPVQARCRPDVKNRQGPH